MPLLYYWTRENYEDDVRSGLGFAYHLNQGSRRLHEIDLGDSLWAFTRNAGGDYVLAAQLVISHRTLNHQGFRYGRFRVHGDPTLSRYFEVERQASAESLIRGLAVATKARVLGRSFQGRAAVKVLGAPEHHALAVYAESLQILPTVAPEEEMRLELLDHDDDDRLGHRPMRNRRNVLQLRELYGGRCQVCEWSASKAWGSVICEAHHAVWLSRGGPDDLQNMVLLCPTHHRIVHAVDAPLDYADLAFVLPDQRQVLRLN